MLRKFAGLAALTLAGAALFVPDATFARGGMGGGSGGFRGAGFRAPAVIHRPPFMVRTGRSALGRNASGFRTLSPSHGASSTLPPSIARRLPARAHVGQPFAHLVQRHHGHHHHFVSDFIYPFTTWDDGSYVGVPYDPGAAIPVYAPAPPDDSVIDPPPRPPAPRLTGMRDDNGEACRAERVTVPAGDGERAITVVRC